MPVSALLFDLDGTLVDSHHEICLALDRALRDVGWSLGFAQVEALVDGSPLEVIWETLHPDPSVRPAESEYRRFAQAYRDHYMRDLGHASALYPNVIDTLLSLQAAHPALRFAVVSNKSAGSVTPLLRAMGIAQYFVLMLGCGGTTIAPKPAPDLLLAAAHELQSEIIHCAMIGDTVLDIRAGKRAGMRTVGMSYGMGGRPALEAEGADHVLDTFADLARILRETQA
jgi:phosphoglycolate phosphatase